MDRSAECQGQARARCTGPLAVVVNSRSGRHGEDDTVASLQEHLRESGRAHDLLRVERPGQLPARIAQAVSLARERQGVVVAAGGDGTINAVAQAALEADLPLAVLPRGTFNYFSRRHGLPQDGAEALQVALGGRVQRVQVGLVNGRIFLVNASLGLYPKLLEDRERFKQRYGRSRWVALWAALGTLMRERRRMALHIEHEGGAQHLNTSTIFVANNALQLDRVGIEAEAVEQGQLAAVIVRPVDRLAMIGLMLHGAIGRLGDDDDVIDFSFRTLDVAPIGRFGLRHVKVAFDGETAWMRWPLRFEVSPRPLRLIVP